MITFGAKHVSPATIEKLHKGSPVSCEAEMYKLSPDKFKDNVTMSLAANRLRNILNYAPTIYGDFVCTMKDKCNGQRTEYYALSKNKSKHMFLNPFNILCLAEVSEIKGDPTTILVRYLQKIPRILSERFNHIGTGMLDGIKVSHPYKNIIVHSLPSKVKFYEKNGFVVEGQCPDSRLVEMKYYAKY